MDRITKTHVYFWGSVFSNWADVRFEYKGHTFYNSEQAFMWEKALLFKDQKIADKIFECDSPKEAKALGRKVKNFDSVKWDQVGFDLMVDINYEKFNQNPSLTEILFSTGTKTIVEASPFDKIWGVGLHWDDDRILDEKNWQGKNLLGKALMKVRDRLVIDSLKA
jgi:ribA/ribD-fused uncharacterized protein